MMTRHVSRSCHLVVLAAVDLDRTIRNQETPGANCRKIACLLAKNARQALGDSTAIQGQMLGSIDLEFGHERTVDCILVQPAQSFPARRPMELKSGSTSLITCAIAINSQSDCLTSGTSVRSVSTLFFVVLSGRPPPRPDAIAIERQPCLGTCAPYSGCGSSRPDTARPKHPIQSSIKAAYDVNRSPD